MVMTAREDKSLLKALEIAIQREANAFDNYRHMARHVQDAGLKNKLQFLSKEEAFHREKLDSLYRELSGGKKCRSASRKGEADAEGGEVSSVIDILRSAAQKEQEAHHFYVLASHDTKEAELHKLFEYLAGEELIHQQMIMLEITILEGREAESPLETIPWHLREWW
ncbi:MAG: ferritin family protein [Candidatus Eremiobacteraeota bacterium]|nr:ferritin family protein [Candidatus Eremiobacteraeota bacterium]